MKNSGTAVFQLKYLETEEKRQSLQSHRKTTNMPAQIHTKRSTRDEASINVNSSTS